MTGSESPRFDHVVVLMFENRSFDNLLGGLYAPGEVPRFEGTRGREFSNPVPADLAGSGFSRIPYHPAQNMDTPDPDPGEEYPHVNTQLFGTVDPPGNRDVPVDRMQPPYNAPGTSPAFPTMEGFVTDYANAFRVELGRAPRPEELAEIMAGYSPEQMPVLSTLAREFACFDHWFCEVPSQTYANRSFFHAASSSGFVNNAPAGKFATRNDAPTIFERLEGAGQCWRVYIDPEQLLPVTALIHARRLAPFFATHFATLFDFYDDAREGRLPEYAFLEPNMLFPRSDMHPPGAARLRRDLHLPPPTALQAGEELLARVYDAIRTSASTAGSNWSNTLFLITFDEHGGTYDHVPPPAVPPPTDRSAGEEGFRFDRSGVRIPAIIVSAWVDPRTVVTGEYRSTSLIRTLRERWSLGEPLTQRDAIAPDLRPVLARLEPRPAGSWPIATPRPVPLGTRLLGAIDSPLSHLERDLVGEALAHEAALEGGLPQADAQTIGRREARDHLRRIRDKWFPGLARGRSS
jgi:phospholipase C